MPCTIAHIELFHPEIEDTEDIVQEAGARAKSGPRKKLVARIEDTDGVILAQALKTMALRKKLKDCPKPLPSKPGFLSLWRDRRASWRWMRLKREKMEADRCLLEAAAEELLRAMDSDKDIAIEPHPPAPFYLMPHGERFKVREMISSAYRVQVWICESESLLGGYGKVLACVA